MMELDTIFCGDALNVLRTLPDNFVHCCITSPPYYALRDYGAEGQIRPVPFTDQVPVYMRAADVMLKERRRLVFVVRETPLSLIHLRNMAALTEAGAVILPASPSFYAAPQGIEELCGTVADRTVALLGVDIPRYEWGK